MESTLDYKGKVSEFIGKKGSIELNDANIAGTARIMVTLVPEKGESIKCWLSTNLSALVRAKTVTLGNLLSFQYAENEKGHHYIVRPQGNVISIKAKDLTEEEYITEDINIEDLIAY